MKFHRYQHVRDEISVPVEYVVAIVTSAALLLQGALLALSIHHRNWVGVAIGIASAISYCVWFCLILDKARTDAAEIEQVRMEMDKRNEQNEHG